MTQCLYINKTNLTTRKDDIIQDQLFLGNLLYLSQYFTQNHLIFPTKSPLQPTLSKLAPHRQAQLAHGR